MPAVTLLTSNFNTTSGTKTPAAATPAVDDLIVIITAHTGNTSSSPPTDNNADGLGTYSLATTAVKASSADTMRAWVRDALVGSATSTSFSHAPGTSTGGGLWALKVTGMSRKGVAAILQNAIQSNQASGGTPTPVLAQAANTINALIGAVFNATNPAGMTPRAGWTERSDVGYTTPASGGEVMTIDSGETASSIAWGGTSASAFASMVLELDARNTVQVGQSVPDATLTATVGVTAALAVSQAMPDASLLADTQTYTHTVDRRGRARRASAISRTNRPLGFFVLGSDGGASHLTLAQALPDTALSASAAVTTRLNASQPVVDATLTATVATRVGVTVAQSLPDAANTASASAPASLTTSQSVVGPTTAASSSVTIAATVAQSLPDASNAATSGVVVAVTASQSVPLPAFSSTVSTQGGLQVLQQVPDATLVATIGVRDSVTVAQSLPDASLAASGKALVSLTASQPLPDAALTASVAHTLTANPRRRFHVTSRTSRTPRPVSYTANSRTLTTSQLVDAPTTSSTAKAVDSVVVSQALPDAVLTATAVHVVSLASSQALPDAELSASLITALQQAHGARYTYVVTGRKAVVVWRGPDYVPPPASLVVAQQVDAPTQAALAAALLKAQVTQSLPDAVLAAQVGVVAKSSLAQALPHASMSASAAAVDSAAVAQSLPDAVLAASAIVVDRAQVDQQVPDPVTFALVRTNATGSNVIVLQQVPDAALVAQATLVAALSSAQQLPDAVTSILATVPVGARYVRQEDPVSLAATGRAVVSLAAGQQVDAPALAANMFSSNRLLSSDQQVPHAVMVANVTAKVWGVPSRMLFHYTVRGRIRFTWTP